jgi:hypothetical protein
VEVQSSARRSYRAVVMPTEALLTLGMLKLTSRMMKSFHSAAVEKEALVRTRVSERQDRSRICIYDEWEQTKLARTL